ncbi:MAG: DUF167 family protein [Methanomassiliicoccales archaeon]|nr:DUF167 family protein [Methanomassiliicoccales archaeon]
MKQRFPDVDLTRCLRGSGEGTELDVIVTPNSTTPGIGDVDPWRHRLVVKVRAPPEAGKANDEVEETLTSLFKAKAIVVRGHTQRMKVVHVDAPMPIVRSALEGRR